MTAPINLRQEYEFLKATHEKLVEERAMLQSTGADGSAYQDHQHRMRRYLNALDTYRAALEDRRKLSKS